jgi:hypothetical protein
MADTRTPLIAALAGWVFGRWSVSDSIPAAL